MALCLIHRTIQPPYGPGLIPHSQWEEKYWNESWHMVLWKNIMDRIHENLEYKEFSMPATVSQKTVCSKTGLLATTTCPGITEYFADGSIPTQYCSGHYVAPKKKKKIRTKNLMSPKNPKIQMKIPRKHLRSLFLRKEAEQRAVKPYQKKAAAMPAVVKHRSTTRSTSRIKLLHLRSNDSGHVSAHPPKGFIV